MFSHLRRCCAVALIALVALLAVVMPASAHDELVASNPAAGADLDTFPTSVVLTFSGPPMKIGTTILVVDADGKDLRTGDLDFDDNAATVTAHLAGGAPNAWYQVRWRVVSGDGHVLSGAYDFGVGDTSKAKKVGLAAGSTPAAQASSGPDSSGSDSSGPESSGSDSRARTLLVAAGGAVLAFAVFAAWVLRPRRPSPERPSSESSSTKGNQES